MEMMLELQDQYSIQETLILILVFQVMIVYHFKQVEIDHLQLMVMQI